MIVQLVLTQERKKSYKQAQLKYYWTDMRKQIYNHIDNCNICAEVKGHTRTSTNVELPNSRETMGKNSLRYLGVTLI